MRLTIIMGYFFFAKVLGLKKEEEKKALPGE